MFFQVKTQNQFRFYKLSLGLDQRSTTHINWNSHITLNKKLPEAIIHEIMSYLSIKDMLHLCISKLFLPCFVNSPWFFKKINAYFTHLLGNAYAKNTTLWLICTLHPTIVNDEFYFSVNLKQLSYFKNLYAGKNTVFSLNVFNDILETCDILFQPYKRFKRRYLKIIRTFPNCHPLCPCLKYRNAPFHVNYLT